MSTEDTNMADSTATSTQQDPRITAQNTYKEINQDTENRRKLKTPNPDDIAATNENRRVSFLPYNTRISTVIKIPPSANMTNTFSNIMRQLLKRLQQVDPTVIIQPWLTAHITRPIINKPNQVPRDFFDLKQYFHRFYFPKDRSNGGKVYPQLYIGHTTDIQEILKELHEWLNSQGHGLFHNMLQEEDVKENGFFCYSTQEMDRGALRDEIVEKFKFPVGLKWKNTNPGTSGAIPQNQQVKAIVIEVKTATWKENKSELMKFYGTTQKVRADYPNGLRFRFVKNINTCINQQEKSKVIQLREKQRAFLRCIRTTQIPNLIQLDYNPKPNQPTARQMIMSINSANTENPRPLFLSADLNWNGTAHTIQYGTQHQSEAECIINTIFPFLSHFYPEAGIDALFNAEAKENSKDLIYDTEQKMIVDKNAQDMDEDDDDLLGFDIEFNSTELEDQLRPSERNVNPYDDESVSTFATQRSKRR